MAKIEKNCPCLSKEMMEAYIKKICEENGYDHSKFNDAVNDSFIGWYSRSMAAAMFVFCKDEHGDLYVLASVRGEEAADFQGYWNCVCGYLDYNESLKDAALRELKEEVGVEVDPSIVNFFYLNDDPLDSNRQNITARFCAFVENKTIKDFTFSKEGNEGKEVGAIEWVKIADVSKRKWAFGHDKIIAEILKAKREGTLGKKTYGKIS